VVAGGFRPRPRRVVYVDPPSLANLGRPITRNEKEDSEEAKSIAGRAFTKWLSPTRPIYQPTTARVHNSFSNAQQDWFFHGGHLSENGKTPKWARSYFGSMENVRHL